MKVYSYIISLLLLLGTESLQAQKDLSIAAEAVLGKLVVMQINGKREKLRVGQSRHGVKVVEANNSAVIVLINGDKRRIKVGAAAVRSNYTTSKKVAQISRNRVGMYTTTGMVNKQTARFLVDTGATYVAFSEQYAKTFGIDPKSDGRQIQVSTANGVVPAYLVRLNSVTVGSITVEQVEGVVVLGKGLPEILLGMSFLNRVDVSYKDGVMTLESK